MSSFTMVISFVISLLFLSPAYGQPTNPLIIDWEVANRFRLFAEEKDFEKHLKATETINSQSVLKVEQELNKNSDRGWAAALGELCYDSFRGRIKEFCVRDEIDENYLNPQHARLKLKVTVPAEYLDTICEWTAVTGSDKQTISKPCKETVTSLRARTENARSKEPTQIKVVARRNDGQSLAGSIQIRVRDVFIVGMGDSIASGEGNPNRPVRLDFEGKCFRNFRSQTDHIYLPGRRDQNGQILYLDMDCLISNDDWAKWRTGDARWLYSGCHRSIYGYQSRTALAIALLNRQITVTYIPLGCTGATIREGIVGSQFARERDVVGYKIAPRSVESQLSALTSYLKGITDRTGYHRPVDLILLTVGANDIGFGGLVANLLLKDGVERSSVKSTLVDVEKARSRLKGSLRDDFALLRRHLRKVTGGDLKRVVYTTYWNPGAHNDGQACPTSRRGFDGHPAFHVDGNSLKKTIDFVESELIPSLKSHAKCTSKGGCKNPSVETMGYVDDHLKDFRSHGICAEAPSDPEFDRECFKDGDTFRFVSDTAGAFKCPLSCGCPPDTQFRPYRSRARWIRTPNDAYLTAMSYITRQSDSILARLLMEPSNLHDAYWGITSQLYSGAIHPTAEGHAAMADGALKEASRRLGLSLPRQVE